MPFLTDLDSRAKVKGSRDPLGLQPIWTHLGRHVVGNLTTVTRSVTDFTTLLLGYYFAERVADAGSPSSELETFLKFEQLAAYARGLVNTDWTFRGVDRARRNVNDGKVRISAESTAQILSDQRIYGLWGLFTVPARSSGLLDSESPRLTEVAHEAVERLYVPTLSEGTRGMEAILDLLSPKVSVLDVDGKHRKVLEAVAGTLGGRRRTARERDFYRRHLIEGGPDDLTRTRGLQTQLAELLERTLSLEGFTYTPDSVGQLAKEARRGQEAETALSLPLARIASCETLLAPISVLFSFLLTADGATFTELGDTLRKQWGVKMATIDLVGIEQLKGELAAATRDIVTGEDASERMLAIATALSTGDYPEALERLIEQNAFVMRTRGGAPWVEAPRKKLRVRLHDESGALPTRDELRVLWRFPYFLDSLREIVRQLSEN